MKPDITDPCPVTWQMCAQVPGHTTGTTRDAGAQVKTGTRYFWGKWSFCRISHGSLLSAPISPPLQDFVPVPWGR